MLTTDTTEGFAVTIGVNLDGSTTVTDDSSQTAVNPVGGATAPEPGTAQAVFTVLQRGYFVNLPPRIVTRSSFGTFRAEGS